jgi:hypothetical protein
MTARADYIKHCESLGIHRSLAGVMAEEAVLQNLIFSGVEERYGSAAEQLAQSFLWVKSEQQYDFWRGVFLMFKEMAKTGECK